MAQKNSNSILPYCGPGRVAGVFLLALFLLATTPARGEELHTRFFRDITLGSGLHFQRWSGEGDLSIQGFSIPITFIFPVSKRLSLDLVTGSGFASLDRGTSSSLSGLTNTKIRASYILGDEVALVTVGLSAPTGKTGLDDEEQGVSNYLSQNALSFRTPNFGQGLDLNVGIATARKVGEMVFGLGVGYLLKGEFTPRASERDSVTGIWAGGLPYQPGKELSLTAGADRKILDGAGKVTVDFVYTLYGEDENQDRIMGTTTFQSGNKILVRGLAQFEAKGLDWRVHLVERSKGKNTSVVLGSETEFSNGNQVEAGVSVLKSLSTSLGLRGMVDLKLYGANDRDRGKATILGLGPGVRYKLSPARFIDVNLKYGRGSIDDATVSGIELSGGIWIRL